MVILKVVLLERHVNFFTRRGFTASYATTIYAYIGGRELKFTMHGMSLIAYQDSFGKRGDCR